VTTAIVHFYTCNSGICISLELVGRMYPTGTIGRFEVPTAHMRDLIKGVCFARCACAAATPLPSVIGYPTSIKDSSTPAKAPSSCNCKVKQTSVHKQDSCFHVTRRKAVVSYLVHVSEVANAEDFPCNFVEADSKAQVVLLVGNLHNVAAVDPRRHHHCRHGVALPLVLLRTQGKPPRPHCLPANRSPWK
jgi:hypothetical protein